MTTCSSSTDTESVISTPKASNIAARSGPRTKRSKPEGVVGRSSALAIRSAAPMTLSRTVGAASEPSASWTNLRKAFPMSRGCVTEEAPSDRAWEPSTNLYTMSFVWAFVRQITDETMTLAPSVRFQSTRTGQPYR